MKEVQVEGAVIRVYPLEEFEALGIVSPRDFYYDNFSCVAEVVLDYFPQWFDRTGHYFHRLQLLGKLRDDLGWPGPLGMTEMIQGHTDFIFMVRCPFKPDEEEL